MMSDVERFESVGRQPVRFAIQLAPWGRFSNPHALAALARDAEQAGWDGFFVWDSMLHDPDELPKADPWIALAAVAIATQRIRIGTMVTPLARRRPWKLARETVTLDHLSNGRLILGAGLGDPSEQEFDWFGEPGSDHRTRAAMLDEALAIVAGLWSGEPFSFDGAHYRLHRMRFLPTPLQQPRIPIWIGGWWPNRAPMRRAARWDGVQPGAPGRRLSPDEVREIVAYIGRHRGGDEPFDVAISGSTLDGDPQTHAPLVARYAAAGATWWIEAGGAAGRLLAPDELEQRVRRGPPR